MSLVKSWSMAPKLLLASQSGESSMPTICARLRNRKPQRQRAWSRMGFVLEERFVRILHGVTEHALGFLGIENREGSRQPDGFAVHPKRAVTDAVKRAAPEARGFDTREVVHAM